MRTSLKWIKDLVPGIEDLTPQEYLDAMTLSGSKGEYYVELDKNLENIVVGQILKIEKHPDADKLVICQVNVGQEEPVQIVTGAPNVFEGAVVPVVLAGGRVAGGHDGSTPPEEGIKIKKGKTPCALLAKSSKALLHGKGRRRLHSAAFAARRKRAVQASSNVVYSEMPLNASLHELFDAVVTQGDVLRSKPDPFCYNMVI